MCVLNLHVYSRYHRHEYRSCFFHFNVLGLDFLFLRSRRRFRNWFDLACGPPTELVKPSAVSADVRVLLCWRSSKVWQYCTTVGGWWCCHSYCRRWWWWDAWLFRWNFLGGWLQTFALFQKICTQKKNREKEKDKNKLVKIGIFSVCVLFGSLIA